MNEKKPFSLIIIIFSIALFFSYHIYYHFVNVVNDNLIDNYYQNEEIIDTSENIEVAQKININNKSEDYYGILTIPKINLKTGFYNKDSSKNNVNNSVTLLNESVMPNENGSIIYLAAHSGSGYLAYFKDLEKLTNEDIINVDVFNKKYIYTITDIYELPKNGEIIVNRNINEDYLVLTTCSKNKNMQLVIISKMINKV